MVIQRSRQWVKDRLPAFICRETGWWVTRWIQCNVFLCPQCRKEYRSLKSVWDKLDNWQVEAPEDKVESCFIESFRQKYPGAYEEGEARSAVSVLWLPKVASVCVIALLGVAVFWRLQDPGSEVPTTIAEAPVELPAVDPPIADSSTTLAPPAKVEVVEAPPPNSQPIPENVVASVPQRFDRAPSNLNALPLGARFRITSTLEPVSSQQEFRSPMRSRTIEINDMPVSGFESLTRPYEEERPY